MIRLPKVSISQTCIVCMAIAGCAQPKVYPYQIERTALEECENGARSKEACRAHAEALIEKRRNHEGHNLALLHQLTEDSIPLLRRLVVESPLVDFHWGALSALSHMGDIGIVDNIKLRQQQFGAEGDRRSVGMLGYYWLRINVQKSPRSLLEFIATSNQTGGGERYWAIQRAIDRGIPKSDIREAILAHAQRVKKNERGFRPGLSGIKSQGIALGVLKESDLPGVKYYTDFNDIVHE